jgi:6-pyruvoyltetrahydropterin/6-carboxytetrahydropterin synthase
MKAIKDFSFSAAHSLSKVCDGHQCMRLHGHNYRVRIECSGDLDDKDMVIDFADIKAVVKPMIDALDHQNINEIVGYENTTSEWLCEWFVRQIGGRIPVSAVEVWETETCCARLEVSQ